MIKTKLLMFVFVLLVMSFSVNAQTNCYMNESFDSYNTYSDLLSNGWYEGDGSPSTYMQIIDVGSGDKELRINASAGSSNSIIKSVLTDFNVSGDGIPMNCSLNDVTIEFDVRITAMDWQIAGVNQELYIFSESGGQSAGNVDQYLGFLGIYNVNPSWLDTGLDWISTVDVPSNVHWKIITSNNADPSKCTINYWLDGVNIWNDEINAQWVNQTYIKTGNNGFTIDTQWYTDNIQIYDGSTVNYCGTSSESTATAFLQVGNACSDSSECITGKCSAGQCSLKLFREECVENYECLSGECVNDMCSKPSSWQMIEQSKQEQFGDDSTTNNFLALFLIIGVPVVIIWGGKGHLASLMVGGLAFIGLSIFFAVVGWLSPFILLGIFLVLLLIIVFVFVLRGSD